jgi:hypothetical protein
MSDIAIQVRCLLDNIFPPNPHRRVFDEHFVKYKGSRLFFDFYIKEIGVFVEVQGRQHTQFVKHFHGTIENFRGQKYRDNLKIEYVQKENLCLVYINYNEKITEELLLQKINDALDSKEGTCF